MDCHSALLLLTDWLKEKKSMEIDSLAGRAVYLVSLAGDAGRYYGGGHIRRLGLLYDAEKFYLFSVLT